MLVAFFPTTLSSCAAQPMGWVHTSEVTRTYSYPTVELMKIQKESLHKQEILFFCYSRPKENRVKISTATNNLLLEVLNDTFSPKTVFIKLLSRRLLNLSSISWLLYVY